MKAGCRDSGQGAPVPLQRDQLLPGDAEAEDVRQISVAGGHLRGLMGHLPATSVRPGWVVEKVGFSWAWSIPRRPRFSLPLPDGTDRSSSGRITQPPYVDAVWTWPARARRPAVRLQAQVQIGPPLQSSPMASSSWWPAGRWRGLRTQAHATMTEERQTAPPMAHTKGRIACAGTRAVKGRGRWRMRTKPVSRHDGLSKKAYSPVTPVRNPAEALPAGTPTVEAPLGGLGAVKTSAPSVQQQATRRPQLSGVETIRSALLLQPGRSHSQNIRRRGCAPPGRRRAASSPAEAKTLLLTGVPQGCPRPWSPLPNGGCWRSGCSGTRPAGQ